MAIWITVIAIVASAMVASLLWRKRLRRTDSRPDDSARKDTVPVELSATLRSYVIPNRWLRSPAGSLRSRAAAAHHPRYAGASVERAGEAAEPAVWSLLPGRTRLGRDADNHVVLEDERVSLHHALITVRDGVYWLEDLGSTNGTFVGGDRRVMAAHPLVDGEEIRLGGVVLVFRGQAEAAPA
ncbi:MAG TPA: FHA domain-containing protein [Thermoanaerobaculia bacterium]|nr:FHA domain-containing protein [Thermoanaerobaculia bacterium]